MLAGQIIAESAGLILRSFSLEPATRPRPCVLRIGRFAPVSSSSIVPIAHDPEFASIESLWPQELKGTAMRLKKIDGLDCAMLRHDQLLFPPEQAYS